MEAVVVVFHHEQKCEMVFPLSICECSGTGVARRTRVEC